MKKYNTAAEYCAAKAAEWIEDVLPDRLLILRDEIRQREKGSISADLLEDEVDRCLNFERHELVKELEEEARDYYDEWEEDWRESLRP